MNTGKTLFFQRTPIVVLFALICTSLWGSAFPAIKLGYAWMNIASTDTPSQILFAGLRFTLAGILTILIASISKKEFIFPKRENWGKVTILSMMQTVIQYVFFYIGLAHASGVKCSIMEATNVFAALIISSLLFHIEKMNLQKVLGCIIGFAGVIIVNLNGASLDSSFSLMGEGFIVISAISAGFSSVYIKRYSKYEDPVILSGYQFFLGGIIMIVSALLFGGHLNTPSPKAIMILLWLAFVSAAAYSIWSVLLKYNPVTKVAIFGFTNPIIGALLSALILDEKNALGINCFIALVLVTIGICLVNAVGETTN